MIPSFLIAPLVCLAAVTGMFALDRFHVSQRDSAREELAALKEAAKAQQLKINALTDTQTGIAETVSKEHVRVVTKYRTVTQQIVKEVPTYVTKADDARCVIPWGFVRIHDAAASGDVPAPTDQPLPAASDVTLSQTAAVLAGNYGLCLEWRTEAATWRDWYQRNAAAVNLTNGTPASPGWWQSVTNTLKGTP